MAAVIKAILDSGENNTVATVPHSQENVTDVLFLGSSPNGQIVNGDNIMSRRALDSENRKSRT